MCDSCSATASQGVLQQLRRAFAPPSDPKTHSTCTHRQQCPLHCTWHGMQWLLNSPSLTSIRWNFRQPSQMPICLKLQCSTAVHQAHSRVTGSCWSGGGFAGAPFQRWGAAGSRCPPRRSFCQRRCRCSLRLRARLACPTPVAHTAAPPSGSPSLAPLVGLSPAHTIPTPTFRPHHRGHTLLHASCQPASPADPANKFGTSSVPADMLMTHTCVTHAQPMMTTIDCS